MEEQLQWDAFFPLGRYTIAWILLPFFSVTAAAAAAAFLHSLLMAMAMV